MAQDLMKIFFDARIDSHAVGEAFISGPPSDLSVDATLELDNADLWVKSFL